MTELSQSEFGRAARGVHVVPGAPLDVDYYVLGMISSAHAALREVHKTTPDFALSDFAGKMSKFLLQGGAAADWARKLTDCVERYVEWDEGAVSAAALPTKGLSISFEPDHIVRARPDVVLGPQEGPGEYEARAVLMDDIPLDRGAAEMIALPVLEFVRAKFGADSTAAVEVWQLQRGDYEAVAADAAEARRADVEALLASL
ncbi:MAG: hypothetical protein QOD71_3443 [Thermoleophilaceae bacterium]|nr:hypothetical protein [Thermoleophilaceae bacterium]